MQNDIIENDKIQLIPITDEYTKLIVSWRNNPRVFNNFIFSEKMTEEMHMKWLKENEG